MQHETAQSSFQNILARMHHYEIYLELFFYFADNALNHNTSMPFYELVIFHKKSFPPQFFKLYFLNTITQQTSKIIVFCFL